MATIKFIQESRQSISAMKGVISYCLKEKKVADDATGQRMVSGIFAMARTHLRNF